MSEPLLPVPAPEDEGETRGEQAFCAICGNVLRRVSLDEWSCQEHGIVRPVYLPREENE